MAFLSTIYASASSVTHLGISDLLTRIWLPSVTQLRYNRPNLQRPLPMHYKRKRILAVCKPRYPDPPKVCQKYFENIKSLDKFNIEEKPYHKFLAREMRHLVESHPMLAIFQEHSFTQHEILNIRGMLFDMKFPMQLYYEVNIIVATNAFRGTKYEPILPLVVPKTSFGYCKTTDVAKLLKVLKKMPQFLLIGLVLEDRLLHRDDIEKIARLPNIDVVRGDLCATLNLAGQSLVNALQSSQLNLVNNLRIHSSSTSESDKS